VEAFKDAVRTAVRVYRDLNNVAGQPAFTPRQVMNSTPKYIGEVNQGDHAWQTKESVTETNFKTGDVESSNKVVDKEFSGNAIKALAGKKNEQKMVIVYQTTTVEDIGGVVSEVNTKKTTTTDLVVGEDRKEKQQVDQRDLKGDLLQQAKALNAELGGLRQTL